MTTEEKIRIMAVGDVAFNAGYSDLVRQGRTAEVFAGVAPLLRDVDLVVGNLECPLTERPSVAPPWRYYLKGSPAYASVLQAAGFQLMSLANNHMMDCGWEAVQETMNGLHAQGILTVGAGRNLSEARLPARIVVSGMKVSFLAYCSVPVRSPLYATSERPGVAPASPALMLEDIRAERQNSDLVAVLIHWGMEYVSYPAPRQRRLARTLMDAGANILIGHHPHILQGAERLNGAIVAYSLGNFTFAEEDWTGATERGEPFKMKMKIRPVARRSAALRISVSKDGRVLHHELIPAYLRRTLLVVQDTRPARLAELARLCAVLERSFYSIFWLAKMLQSRLGVISEQFYSRKSVWDRLRRIRPRHFREIFRIMAREMEQLRGGK